MPRIEGKGEFGQARWRLVYAPQIPSLLSVDPTVDPFKSLANNISFGTEVEFQLGKRLQVILKLFTLHSNFNILILICLIRYFSEKVNHYSWITDNKGKKL